MEDTVSTFDTWLMATTGILLGGAGCVSSGRSQAAAGAPAAVTAWVGATVLDGKGNRIPNGVLLIEGQRIACVGTREGCAIPRGAELRDVAGRWIAPGLVDAHVHFSQNGWLDSRPDFVDLRTQFPYEQVVADMRQQAKLRADTFLCSGVTAVFDVGGYPWTWEVRDRALREAAMPHIAATGPLLTFSDNPFTSMHPDAEKQFLRFEDEGTARALVHYLAANSADAVKIWFLPVPQEKREQVDAQVTAA